MPLIGHLYLSLISLFESSWFTSYFHTIYSRFYFVNLLHLNVNLFYCITRQLWGFVQTTLADLRGCIWLGKKLFKYKNSDLNQINPILLFLLNQKLPTLARSEGNSGRSVSTGYGQSWSMLHEIFNYWW